MKRIPLPDLLKGFAVFLIIPEGKAFSGKYCWFWVDLSLFRYS